MTVQEDNVRTLSSAYISVTEQVSVSVGMSDGEILAAQIRTLCHTVLTMSAGAECHGEAGKYEYSAMSNTLVRLLAEALAENKQHLPRAIVETRSVKNERNH